MAGYLGIFLPRAGHEVQNADIRWTCVMHVVRHLNEIKFIIDVHLFPHCTH